MDRRDFFKKGAGSLAALSLGKKISLKGSPTQQKLNSDTIGDFETYHANCRVRSGILHGGIGTGGIELRKDGQFYNWSIANNLPRGIGEPLIIKNHIADGYDIDRQDNYLTFMVRFQEKGKDPQLKLLRLIDNLEMPGTGIYDITYIFPWCTPVAEIRYKAKFPFTWLEFSDPDMPFIVKMEVFSPYIPHDIKNSTLPGVYFNFEIVPKAKADVDVTILMMQRNLVGYNTNDKYFVTEIDNRKNLKFIQMSAGMDKKMVSYGNMGIGCFAKSASYYAGWSHLHPFWEVALREKDLPDLDDTEGKNSLEKEFDWMPVSNGRNMIDPDTGKKVGWSEEGQEQGLFSSIADSFNLRENRLQTTFVLTWFFPNQYYNIDAVKLIQKGNTEQLKWAGHYYNNFFKSSGDVADYLQKEQQNLNGRTREFLSNFYASTIDEFVLDQINSHLNTMIANVFISKKFECLVADDGGLARRLRVPIGGLNPDVNIYGSFLYATLFPEIYKSALTGMVENKQLKNGAIGTERSDWPADMVNMICRHYFWTGDEAFLKELWPAMNRVMDFALNVLDKDRDKVPEIYAHVDGCTFDNLPMYGVASYIVSLWIAGLHAMIQSAEKLNDQKALLKYRKLLEVAYNIREKDLWNGKYYRLSKDKYKDHGINEGCLTDQMFGQWLMHHSGLGEQISRERRNKIIKIILDKNFREGFLLKNCSYPDEPFYGKIRKDVWNDQDNTPWSGVELAFASFLLYEGFYEEGLKVIKTVDDRYRKAGLYFNHIEAMGHYNRPMSSWAILNGMLGLSMNLGDFLFRPSIPKKNFKIFFATPTGTAYFIRQGKNFKIEILTGYLEIKSIKVKDQNDEVIGEKAFPKVTKTTNAVIL